ncbi:hypothetical protein [Paludisphaera borealis]|uniref:Glycosyltransferase RgtA/B/C/D-like domain-containing protein n=1 Tax=Paludisphaera borealis TaxID=1387353 RepID=A0A1U7CRT9_9BACT|nr:hypothetical protein [Paludisphaera borealis]APW61651.1 hypothetical protein BSF38_03176 [Paludisphaera borealis]
MSMQRHGRRPSGFALALALSLFLIPATASLAVLAVRFATVWGPSGPLHMTTGGESVSLLNVMKIQHGLPLYEEPIEPPFYPTTLYNAGFYHLYAAATSGLAPDGPGVARGGRVLTLGLACLGLAATLAYGFMGLFRRESGAASRSRWVGPAMAVAAVAVVLGGLPGWWLLSIRPDVGGAACGAVALAIALGMGTKREFAAGASAGLVLAAAWSFKQSCVLILGGLILSALIQRRWRFLAALIAPVAATVAAFTLLLGPEYRYNTVFATSLAGFDFKNVVVLAAHFAIKGIFPLAVSILGLVVLPRAGWLRRDERVALAACWATTLFGGWAACYRNGSAMNYFFEFSAVAGFLALILARRLIEAVEAREGLAAPLLGGLAVAALACSLQDVGRLASPGRFDLVQHRFTAARNPEMERARDLVRAADGPVYCQPGLSGLAWNLPFPVYTFDDEPFFHRPAKRRGLLRGPGMMGQIAERHFRLVVLESEAVDLVEPMKRAGYIQQPDWPTLLVFTAPSEDAQRLTVNR